MSRINDVGGMQGFPPVEQEADEPPFHADWEAHVFAMNRSLIGHGLYNLDEFRDAIERMPPQQYLEASYYEKWLHAITTLLAEKGVLTWEELAGDLPLPPRRPGRDQPGRPATPHPAAALRARRHRHGRGARGPPPAARQPGASASGRAGDRVRRPLRRPGPVR
jgi:hypothetical protein